MKKLTAISFFSGAGGIDIGLEAAGFRVLASSDIMPEACETLRKNWPKMKVFGPPVLSGDINSMNGAEILRSVDMDKGDIDLVVGGPPCQSFSVAAAQRFLKGDKKFKRVGFESPDKGELVFRFAERVIEMRPKAFMIENVPGILTIDGGNGISVVYEMLEQAGYHVSKPFVLNARDFGVPQSRKRAFVIGSLDGLEILAPEATHGPEDNLFFAPYVSVAQALIGMTPTLPNHLVREHKPESIARYRTLKCGAREPLGRVDRLDPLKPSKTVIAGGASGGGRSHLHPFLARTLSARECARLQTFPDDYQFSGTSARQFTLVGNAVPPLLAEVLGRHIASTFFGRKYKVPLKLSFTGVSTEIAAKQLEKESAKRNPELLYLDSPLLK